MGEGSPLAATGYSYRARDLARFVDEPADLLVASYVTREIDGPNGWRRPLLEEDDLYTLLLFARREAARAFRQNDLDRARTAVAALTLVDVDRIDFRDLSPDFPLLAVRELGGDPDREIDAAVARSSPGTASYFAAARERAGTIDLADCALVRIETSYGVGFVDNWAGRRSQPVALAEEAVSLADAIDNEGSYRVSDLHVSDLPGVWFGANATWVPNDGCVGVHAGHVAAGHPHGHCLLVFLATFEDGSEAVRLARAAAEAATSDRPRVAAAADRLLAVFVGGSTIAGQQSLETAESMRRFTELLPARRQG